MQGRIHLLRSMVSEWIFQGGSLQIAKRHFGGRKEALWASQRGSLGMAKSLFRNGKEALYDVAVFLFVKCRCVFAVAVSSLAVTRRDADKYIMALQKKSLRYVAYHRDRVNYGKIISAKIAAVDCRDV